MTAIRIFALTLTLWACAAAAASAQPVGSSTLSVGRTGAQVGTITDDLGQIRCGPLCSGTYDFDCQVGTPDNCTEPGDTKRTTLTTTLPDGFGVVWSRACGEGSSTTSVCTVSAEGFITAHYDDLTAPTSALTGPGAGSRRGTVALTATATDAQSGIANVEFFVGGVSVGTDAVAPYRIDFDTTSRPDGPVTVLARATNGDGDQSSDSAVVTVDNTVPSLTLDGPDGQTFGPRSTQRWTFAATDVTSGLPDVRCSVTPAGAAPSFAACSPGGGSHSVSDRTEGSYSARFSATDAAGNVRVVERTFSIDATAAATRIDSGPPDGSSSTDTSVTFAFSADEAGSTFACRVYPAALTPGAFGPCAGDGTHTASGFAPGAYAFEVVATDPFGNTDPTPEKRTFTVTAASGGGAGGTGGTPAGTPTAGGIPAPGGSTAPVGSGVVAGQRIDALVRTFFTRFGRRTRVGRLTVAGAPQGARVTVTCKGRRHVCPFARVVLPFTGRTLALAPRLKHRKLRAGTVITVSASKQGLVTKTFRYVLRPTRFPAVRIT